jgi:phosphatidylserine/phosphatidylglycerophosphate/cardiolipin synthase-like enzyme
VTRTTDRSAANCFEQPPSAWRDGNRFRLLPDGDQFFPAMLDAIATARHDILLEMYLFSSGQVADRFIDALYQAAERGVTVYLLLDDFGARELTQADRRRLIHPSIHIAWHNPLRIGHFRRYLSRDHRKLLLVDGERAFTGGMGISDAFDPPLPGTRRWRDNAVEIHGPVVGDWRQLFTQTWNHWSDLPLSAAEPGPGEAGSARGRLRASHARSARHMTRSLIAAALGARGRVWIATAYFIPSRRLRRVLRRRARQGLDVRLLLPGPVTDHPGVRHASRRYYARLLRNGVRIFEYQPRFLHAKLVLCDDWLSIGSSNFDRWNLRRNLEANQEIDDPTIAASARQLFEADLVEAREITAQAWRQRPWHHRLVQWFWGRIEVMLDKDD